MTITLTDLFCGAGGSSTGAIQVPGVEVRAASNHWDLAVNTHNENHPDADHICADLSQINPRYFPSSDILWASPECTNHSVAKGRKRVGSQPDLFGEILPDAAAERSRATMWDVPRFTEAHRYRAVIVENVVDAARWVMFDAWLMAMNALGYRHQIVWLNSMHATYAGVGAAQSRDRMYVVFTQEGNPAPELHKLNRPLAVCPECGPVAAMQTWKKPDPWGRYRAQYVYRCPNTKCRNQIVEPAVRPAADIIDWSLEGTRIGDRPKPLAEKTMRRIQAGIDRYWRPLISIEAPMRTMTTRSETGLAFLAQFRERDRLLDPSVDPLTTVVADGANHGLVQAPKPFVAELRGGGSVARSTSDPLCTVTASGNHHGLVTPPLISVMRGQSGNHPADTPLSTVSAGGIHHALLMRNNTARGSDAQMSTPVTEPARTMTTTGHQSLLDAPLPTIDINDVRFRMLEPAEIIAAMDFPSTYVVLGNRREKVRMAGNAVTPCAARDLVAIVAESLGGAA